MNRVRTLRRRYGRASSISAFDAYRKLPVDDSAGSPLAQWGAAHRHLIGAYWTVPVAVPLAQLSGLKAVVQDKRRVASVHDAIDRGEQLPPIEIGVFKSGGGWIVDGNHRLAEARKSKRSSIEARFTFVE